MCGILTVIRKSDKQFDISACRRALSRLSWRGPDLCVSAVWQDRVFLGQTVLSLTGTIQNRKNTYTSSASGRYLLAFNGEIYNYRELAREFLQDRLTLTNVTTDTEVLATLHDVMSAEEIPALLDGMYAYTVLDKAEETLYVVRDVQGEKSLYLYEDESIIVISSEISAIQSLVPGLPINKQALRDYFRTRHFMLLSRTAFQGIQQILPGHVECFQLSTGTRKIAKQHKLGDLIDHERMENNAVRSIDDLADELDSLLIQAVKEMLPEEQRYAAVVSGGVDSSLLSHYLVAYGDPDLLLAVDHVGKDLISCDLSGFEKILGRSIEVLRINETTYASEIVRCQETTCGPLHAHSFIPQSLQSAYAKSAGCRVIFGGEGGDEYFGGYDAYLPKIDPHSSYSPSPYLAYSIPEVDFIEDAPSTLQVELAQAWADSQHAYASVVDTNERGKLAMMLGDAAYQLPAVGLRGSDLMSMMWSLEARSIFLRRQIIAFALNLPLQAKIDPHASDQNMRTKVLLKRLFLRYYPASLLVKKQGFAGFPNESAFFLGSLDDYLAFDFLGIRRPKAQGSYSKATLWKLANIEYFLRNRFR